MITNPLTLSSTIRPALYPLVAAALVAVQYSYVALCFRLAAAPLVPDARFWLTPMPRLMDALLSTHPVAINIGFAVALFCSLLLGIISFRRANAAGHSHWLALLTMLPTIQLGAIIATALLIPSRIADTDDQVAADAQIDRQQTLIGIAVGMTLIVMSVIISANMFGAYGMGLFIFTPLLVGFTTGFSVNTPQPRSKTRTTSAVLIASMLGTVALLMFALEGFMCILLIAPLASLLGFAGGLFGRTMALIRHHPGHPLYSVAVLPLIFLVDAAMPPAVMMTAREELVIAASPNSVWQSLTESRPVDQPPGLVGLSGLAYPIASHLSGEGVGALRTGMFSTGPVRERITHWQPGRALAFRGESHAPAMEEMSPYRIVHAPHVSGYFDTLDTRFTLKPLANGWTRLTVSSRHILRIEPVPYWKPIAEWAIGQNMQRVLRDIGQHAEKSGAKNAKSSASTIPPMI
jgi:hypothetical protein